MSTLAPIQSLPVNQSSSPSLYQQIRYQAITLSSPKKPPICQVIDDPQHLICIVEPAGGVCTRCDSVVWG